ncbi:hypothetical protein ACIRCZ_19620 [Leifsonia sp. NPDC102414]|uniref:hypothetical protein n=1 Tax=Leifsonia sp. NPDC102414 TaxID=3364124 RepID=UPI00382D80C1
MNFDYYDNLFSPIVAMRAGEIGVIVVLQDWGFVEQVQEKHLLEARTIALHPTQFRELFAMVSYLAETNWVSGRQHVILRPPDGGEPVVVITPEIVAASSGSVVLESYAAYVASALSAPIEEIYDGTRAACFIIGDDGTAMHAAWPGTIFTGLTGLPIWPAAEAR